jgi:geranylgeranyl pyrophosphate synthase
VKKAMGEAKQHAERALQTLEDFEPSPEREGLENLVKYIVDRNV